MVKERFDEVYTQEYLNDLIEATYEIALSVYKKYSWNDNTVYSLDDYKQDAAMEILRLFDSRFITPPREGYTQTNLKTYVYSILDKFFTINLINTFKSKRFSMTIPLEYIQMKMGEEADKLDLMSLLAANDPELVDNQLTPDDFDNILRGRDAIERLLENEFSVLPYNTSHTYETDLGYPLSELNIARYILLNYTPNNVVEEYQSTDNLSKSHYIRKQYTNVFTKLTELIKEKLITQDEVTIKQVVLYLKSL